MTYLPQKYVLMMLVAFLVLGATPIAIAIQGDEEGRDSRTSSSHAGPSVPDWHQIFYNRPMAIAFDGVLEVLSNPFELAKDNRDISAILESYKSARSDFKTNKEKLQQAAWEALARCTGLVIENEKTRFKRTFFRKMAADYDEQIRKIDQDILSTEVSIGEKDKRIEELLKDSQNSTQKAILEDLIAAQQTLRTALITYSEQLGNHKRRIENEGKAFFAEKANFAEKAAQGDGESSLFTYSKDLEELSLQDKPGEWFQEGVNRYFHQYIYATIKGPFVFAVLPQFRGEADELVDCLRTDAQQDSVNRQWF